MSYLNIIKTLLILCISGITPTYAQQNLSSINNRVVSAPPDVATLMKFTETPVSYFNGTANVSVPIYEIKSGDLSFPITLNYNTSGIKAAEEAGWVGLGWNISVIAAVNESQGVSNLQNAIKYGIIPPSYSGTYDSQTVYSNLITNGQMFRDYMGICRFFNIQSKNANYEPNIYTLSANGISGKFLAPNDQPGLVSIDGQSIKLSQIANQFTAVLPDGTRYIFDKVIITQSAGSPESTPIEVTTLRTAYLTKIISPTGKIINFKYSQIIPAVSLRSRSQSWGADNAGQFTVSDIVMPGSNIENIYVSEIEFDNGYIKFLSGTREDLDGKKLETIAIYRKGESTPFKRITFNYDYFADPKGNFGDYTQDNLPNPVQSEPEAYRQKRLKLLSVCIDKDAPYIFDYDKTPLPYKTSWAQDIWGYCNGNTIKSLLPDYNYLQFTGRQVPVSLIDAAQHTTLAYRAARFEYMKAGVLNRITYPTGGYTTFKYEPNVFTKAAGAQNLVDQLASVYATGKGLQQQEFDVPEVGHNEAGTGSINPAVLNVRLFCGVMGGTGICNVKQVGTPGGCLGYDPTQPLTGTNNANGLYAIIQFRDANGNWVTPSNFSSSENIFDWHNPLVNGSSCSASGLVKHLKPGHYRIVANYPQSEAQGSAGGPWAYISVTYKAFSGSSTPTIYQGPGLRIGAITDYHFGGKVASRKIVTYETGKLMTPTVFYRHHEGPMGSSQTPVCVDASGNQQLNAILTGNSVSNANYCPSNYPIRSSRDFVILYSNASIPYSYSANGSLFGYEKAFVQQVDGSGIDQGRTMYSYNCKPDVYSFDGLTLPGIPSTAYLDNGTLYEQQEQQRISSTEYKTLRSTRYNYVVGSPNLYWGFKTEYMPLYRNNGAPEYCEPLVDPYSIYLHFYPIRTGHVNLVNKIVQVFDATTPMTIATNYVYNSSNQLRSEITTKSDGKTYSNHSYYPSDYITTGDYLSAMRSANMLNYPIEEISTVNNLAISASYNEYNQHDNIITPSSTYSLNSPAPVNVTASIPNNIRDIHYEKAMDYTYNNKGNLVEVLRTNSIKDKYIWDYSNELVTAAIRNSPGNDYAFTSFESAEKGNWNYAGIGVSDISTRLGKNSYDLSSGAISSPALDPVKTYEISYWTKNGAPYTIMGTVGGSSVQLGQLAGWTNYLHKVKGISSLSINGSGFIDDLRLCSSNAQMVTFNHDPLVGMTSAVDAAGNATYYEYDENSRLTNVKDLNGNIVKSYTYHFSAFNPIGPNGSFSNIAVSRDFTTNNCPAGYVGSQAVSYTVPAGTYFSYISQADADGKAIGDIDANGQVHANNSGTSCIPAPCVTPVINSIDNNIGLSITVHSNVASAGLTTQLLAIIDNATGQQVGSAALPTTTTIINLPAKGKTYKFTITSNGPLCNGIVSQPFIINLP